MRIGYSDAAGGKSGSNPFLFMIVSIVLSLALVGSISRPAMANPKFAVISVDASTGKIIHGKNIDARRYPASLTKVMTLYILFEELRANRLRFDTHMRVSKKASRQQPSKLGLRAGRTITVRDAMFALITKSANDAAMVIAEHISGSQAAFAQRMTRTARNMGMTRTTFKNPNGLPDSRQTTTARDMATLGLRVRRDFPQYYKFFSKRKFRYGKRRYGNYNRLLGRVKGVDGIKTGYTRASGYNLLSSMTIGKRRIVAVVLGARSGRSRNAYMSKILRRDIRKASIGGRRIALVAGKPRGYNPRKAKRVAVAKPAKVRTAPVPRVKPAQAQTAQPKPALAAAPATQPLSADELRRVAAQAAASQPETSQQAQQTGAQPSVTELALQALPAQGVTFKTVTVPEADTKQDSLIVSNAAMALAPSHGSSTKLQSRLQPGTQPVAASPAPSAIPEDARAEGTEVVANQKAVQQKLAEHQASWNIQIGAFPTAEGAKSRIDAAKQRRVRALKDATPFLMAVDKNGGTIYRARFSGLNKRQARTACRQLKRKGVGCFPLAPTS